MKKLPIIYFFVVFILTSCNDRNPPYQEGTDQYEMNLDIAGIYARETSTETKNIQTGQVVGKVIVRDTIFIKKKENGFEINNLKYKFNDYDQFGWKEVGGTQILPTFQATFDRTDSSLVPVQNQFVSPIYVDINKKRIYKDSGKDQPFEKVK